MRALLAGLTMVGGCATVPLQPMPPLPDLGRLESPAADSQQRALVLAAQAAGERSPLFCSIGGFGDTTGLTRPTVRESPVLPFPSAARRSGQQGWVALQFVVGADGVVEANSIVVLGASDSVFVAAARAIIRYEVFSPALSGATPFRALARQMAKFVLR